ncbi:MAG: hypothetical protein WC455_09510 [Dehalococcoidia bacterium]|jgi:hypothetical protein
MITIVKLNITFDEAGAQYIVPVLGGDRFGKNGLVDAIPMSTATRVSVFYPSDVEDAVGMAYNTAPTRSNSILWSVNDDTEAIVSPVAVDAAINLTQLAPGLLGFNFLFPVLVDSDGNPIVYVYVGEEEAPVIELIFAISE